MAPTAPTSFPESSRMSSRAPWSLNVASCRRTVPNRSRASAGGSASARIGFGVALPSSPGFFGPFEAVTRATLGLYAIGPDQAVSYAVAYHLGGFIPITLLGLYSLSQTQVRLRELRRGVGPTQ